MNDATEERKDDEDAGKDTKDKQGDDGEEPPAKKPRVPKISSPEEVEKKDKAMFCNSYHVMIDTFNILQTDTGTHTHTLEKIHMWNM